MKRAWEIFREEGLASLIKKTLQFVDLKTGLVSMVLAPYIAYKSKKLSVKQLLQELYNDSSLISMLYKPMQIRWEIKKLLEILKELKPRYILEIGTARGGTLFLWTRVASEDAIIISTDLPGGLFGGGYPLLRGLAYKRFARNRQRIALIRGDSHSKETLLKVRKVLKGAKLDFLFIDADHTYEGVKKDYEMYSLLVRKGGIIAFHDIVPFDREHDPLQMVGVYRFWNQIKSRFKYLEIVEGQDQGWAGIGVLFK